MDPPGQPRWWSGNGFGLGEFSAGALRHGGRRGRRHKCRRRGDCCQSGYGEGRAVSRHRARASEGDKVPGSTSDGATTGVTEFVIPDTLWPSRQSTRSVSRATPESKLAQHEPCSAQEILCDRCDTVLIR